MVSVSGRSKSSSVEMLTVLGTRSLYVSVVFTPSNVAFDTHSYLCKDEEM